jgi:chemotaxis protein MotB
MSRWERRKPQASHADDWLMTYADMITLLLCFFVIFLIVSISKKSQSPADVPPPVKRVEVQVPVERPPPLQGNLPFHDFDPDDYVDHYQLPVREEAQPNPPAPVPPPVVTPAVTVAAPPAVAAQPADNPKPPPKPQGDRITLVEMNSAAFFDSGSATLSVPGKTILRDIAVKLKADEYRDYRIVVEGHTDDTPIATPQFPSNWELSAARAAAVVRFFLDEGLPSERMRAVGYADTLPKLPDRDAAGRAIPENQARNRRVVITLEKIEKAAP